MTTLTRKHLTELQSSVAEMLATLDRGERIECADANILEARASALAVCVRAAFVRSLVGCERTPEEDRAAQRYIETRREADGIAKPLSDEATVHSSNRDSRRPELEGAA